jgi:hypothetical protein
MNRKVYLREWPALLARYAWTRPVWVRVLGLVAVGYTVALAIVGGGPLFLWLFGIGVILLGVGPILASRRSESEIAYSQRHPDQRFESDFDVLDWVWDRLLPPRAARRFQTAAGLILLTLGVLLAALSIVVLSVGRLD